MRFYRAFILITLITCFCTFAQDLNKTSDIEFIKTQLPILHCNLFTKTAKEEFNKELDLLKENVQNLTNIEFALKLQTIITKMGDAHTSIDFISLLDKLKIYPLNLYWLKDGFYVIAIHKDYEDALGLKLIAINKIPIDDVSRKFENILVKDNEAILKHRLPNIIIFKELLDYLKITNDNSNVFTFTDGKNNKDIIMNTSIELNAPKNFARVIPSAIPLSFRNQKQYFWYELLKEKNILYAQYNVCWGKEMEKMAGSEQKAQSTPSFAEFSDSLISIINKINPDKFIFDLRFNPGGSSLQGTEFVKKIAELKTINKKGKLFIVLGRRTFSSAVINALDFKNNTSAIFVGESTSGSPNHFGEVKNGKLPSTGIQFGYSTKYFRMTNDEIKTIDPDIVVEPNLIDFKNGIDPVLESIYNYNVGL